ncbi:hypothetical protein WJU23_03445 [Prosthecobacter sp. SYSU 5D2]|uniref:hypothetical protein n=1 Tax=Prosthecobacter sp. SYSU 5D2 TaxID=3134134 RepID=UPI0031FEFF7C
MATPPQKKKADPARDLDGNGIIDGADDPSRDLDKDGRIDVGDRKLNDLNKDGRIDAADSRVNDLDGDNEIDANDRRLKQEQARAKEEQSQSVGESLGLKKEDGKWQQSHAQSLPAAGHKLR